MAETTTYESPPPDEFSVAEYELAYRAIEKIAEKNYLFRITLDPTQAMNAFRVLCVSAGTVTAIESKYRDTEVKETLNEADEAWKEALSLGKIEDAEFYLGRARRFEDNSVRTHIAYSQIHEVNKDKTTYRLRAGKKGFLQLVVDRNDRMLTSWQINYLGESPYRGSRYTIATFGNREESYLEDGLKRREVQEVLLESCRVFLPTFPPPAKDDAFSAFLQEK